MQRNIPPRHRCLPMRAIEFADLAAALNLRSPPLPCRRYLSARAEKRGRLAPASKARIAFKQTGDFTQTNLFFQLRTLNLVCFWKEMNEESRRTIDPCTVFHA